MAASSTVETFAAIELRIDTWRWADVPFFISAGKSMASTVTEVIVELKRPPRDIFGEHAECPHYVRFRLGPEIAIAVGMRVMRPGAVNGAPRGEERELVAREDPARETLAYERLLDEAMRGDPTLFARQDEIEAQWRVVDPVLGDVTPVYEYAPGTWGPAQVGKLSPYTCHTPVAGARRG